MEAPRFEPMLATSGRPNGAVTDWVAEPKLDGWRVLVSIGETGVSVRSRNGHSLTGRLPELSGLGTIGCPAVLDGELVAGAGRCDDFYDITSRLTPRTHRPALTFVAFDLLWLDGRTTTGLPQHHRHRKRRQAQALVGEYHQEQLRSLLEHVREGFGKLDAGGWTSSTSTI